MSNRSNHRGMTLIGLLAGLAVLAILAAMLLPVTIRKMDQMARDKEIATLKGFAGSLEQSIMRNRYVPSHTTWIDTVATERGVNPSDVATNLRRQARVFLIDPRLKIGDRIAGQDYTQNSEGSAIVDTATGRVVPPVNPRMIVFSSIGVPLPSGVTTGVASTPEAFDEIWNLVEGTAPASWTGWGGAQDLVVQRVNLSSLFVRIVLTTYSSDGDGQYAIDGGALRTAPATTAGTESYFIKNSTLHLHAHSPANTLDTSQILTRDLSFVYQNNIWRASIEGLGFLGGMDIGSIVDRFLNAPHNPRAYENVEGPTESALAQERVVRAMIDFMQAYQDWDTSGFGSGSIRDIAVAKQQAMLEAVQDLYKNPNHDPPEVACPTP